MSIDVGLSFWQLANEIPEQLQKMGILPSAPKTTPKTPLTNGKRRSIQDDFPKFKPLSSNGLKSFSTMRDPNEMNGESKTDKSGKRRQPEIDSDDELDTNDDVVIKAEKAEDNEVNATHLSTDDARRQGELADGVQKIRVSPIYPAPFLTSLSQPSTAFTSKHTHVY